MKDSAKQHKKTKITKLKKVKKKQRISDQYIYFIPVISLFLVFVVITAINILLKYNIAANKINFTNPPETSDFARLKNSSTPVITAESAIILDDYSKNILYEKKPQLRFSMASTTKIMATLVAMDHYKLTDIITINQIQNEGAVVGFLPGEQFKFEDILYALLLPSANDAAYALAENYPGGINAFVLKMNQKAKEYNLNYTHYADPSGLDDDGNYTTVNDLARLTSIAMNNRKFVNIIATKRKIISTIDMSKSYTLLNLNKLLGYDGIVGVKTGYTQGAGEVLVTAKILKGHRFIIVVMKSENRFSDTQILSDFINNNVTFINPDEYLLNIKN